MDSGQVAREPTIRFAEHPPHVVAEECTDEAVHSPHLLLVTVNRVEAGHLSLGDSCTEAKGKWALHWSPWSPVTRNDVKCPQVAPSQSITGTWQLQLSLDPERLSLRETQEKDSNPSPACRLTDELVVSDEAAELHFRTKA